jgi:hypothetical protein
MEVSKNDMKEHTMNGKLTFSLIELALTTTTTDALHSPEVSQQLITFKQFVHGVLVRFS